MNKLVFIPVLLITLGIYNVANATTYDPCEYKKGKQKCDCYTKQADYFESKMRAGYTASEYNYLEENRKYFRDKSFNCKPNNNN